MLRNLSESDEMNEKYLNNTCGTQGQAEKRYRVQQNSRLSSMGVETYFPPKGIPILASLCVQPCGCSFKMVVTQPFRHSSLNDSASMNNAGVFTWTEISFTTIAPSIGPHKCSRRERLKLIEFWGLAKGVSTSVLSHFVRKMLTASSSQFIWTIVISLNSSSFERKRIGGSAVVISSARHRTIPRSILLWVYSVILIQ